MSTFLYKVVAREITSYGPVNPRAILIDASEFLEIANDKVDDYLIVGVLVSNVMLESGSDVLFLHNFRYSRFEKKKKSFPVIVQGATPEELKKDILKNIEIPNWNRFDDLEDHSQWASDRWSKFEARLDSKLPEFFERVHDSFPIYSKINIAWPGEEAEWEKFKITLYRATVA